MQQYFVREKLEVGGEIVLNAEQSHHIRKVMRMRPDELIRISDNNQVFLARIILGEKEVIAHCIEQIDIDTEFSKPVILAAALIKGERWSYLLQKATELGVSAIYPFESQNSVVKVNDKAPDKLKRWQKIVIEAAEQSLRKSYPPVHEVLDLKELVNVKTDLRVVADENETDTKFAQQDFSNKSILLVIGPEGGFAAAEIAFLRKHGFQTVSLGARILRSETAVSYVLSVIGAQCE